MLGPTHMGLDECFRLDFEDLLLERARDLDTEVDADVEQRMRKHRDVVGAPEEGVLVLKPLVDWSEGLVDLVRGQGNQCSCGMSMVRDDQRCSPSRSMKMLRMPRRMGTMYSADRRSTTIRCDSCAALWVVSATCSTSSFTNLLRRRVIKHGIHALRQPDLALILAPPREARAALRLSGAAPVPVPPTIAVLFLVAPDRHAVWNPFSDARQSRAVRRVDVVHEDLEVQVVCVEVAFGPRVTDRPKRVLYG